jgi:hypothetical protein
VYFEHELRPPAEDIGGLLLAGTESLNKIFDVLKAFGRVVVKDLRE